MSVFWGARHYIIGKYDYNISFVLIIFPVILWTANYYLNLLIFIDNRIVLPDLV